MSDLLLIVVILVVLGALGYGGGFYGGGPNRYWGTGAQPGYNIGGVIGLIIVIVLVLMLLSVVPNPFDPAAVPVTPARP